MWPDLDAVMTKEPDHLGVVGGAVHVCLDDAVPVILGAVKHHPAVGRGSGAENGPSVVTELGKETNERSKDRKGSWVIIRRGRGGLVAESASLDEAIQCGPDP